MNGCIDIGNYYIPVGISCDSLNIDTIQSNNVLCNGDSTGTATASATGGSLGGLFFTYQWDANTGSQTGTTATGLPAGIYFVTVTDTVSNCSMIPIGVSA